MRPDVQRVSSRVVYEDQWVRLRRDETRMRDGTPGSYAVLEKPDFALVVPYENAGFHLVEEYRYPIQRRTWSFPQGAFPPGRTGTPERLAAAELAEETGLRAGTLTPLGYLHTAHGSSPQGFHAFLATDLAPGEPHREPEEQDMRHAWVTIGDFEEMIRTGRVTDDASVAAYTLFHLHHAR